MEKKTLRSCTKCGLPKTEDDYYTYHTLAAKYTQCKSCVREAKRMKYMEKKLTLDERLAAHDRDPSVIAAKFAHLLEGSGIRNRR